MIPAAEFRVSIPTVTSYIIWIMAGAMGRTATGQDNAEAN